MILSLIFIVEVKSKPKTSPFEKQENLINDDQHKFQSSRKLKTFLQMDGNSMTSECKDKNVCKGLPPKHLLCFLSAVNEICPQTCDLC